MNGVFVTVVVLAILGLWAKESPADQGFAKIAAARGKCYVLHPLSGVWRPAVKGAPVPPGSLIQTAPGAEVIVELQGSGAVGEMNLKTTRISVRRPAIFRVDRDSMRDIKVISHLVSAIPDPEFVEASLLKYDLFSSITDAWNQDAAMFFGHRWAKKLFTKKMATLLEKNPRDQDVAVSGASRELKLRSPTDESKVYAAEMPLFYSVGWDATPEGTPSEYVVYMWPAEGRRSVYARTSSTSYTMSIAQPGDFFIQVETADKRYRSEVRTLKVQQAGAQKGDSIEALRRSKYGQSGRDQVALRLLMPPRNFVFAGAPPGTSLSFAWERPRLSKGECVYDFSINGAGGEVIFKQRSAAEQVVWKTRPGRFDWVVRPVSCKVDGRHSEVTYFGESRRIFAVGELADGETALREMVAKGKGGVVFLE